MADNVLANTGITLTGKFDYQIFVILFSTRKIGKSLHLFFLIRTNFNTEPEISQNLEC